MDLLLIHPNDMKEVYGDTLKYTACEPPYWCAVVAQYCLDRNIDVTIIDAEAENLTYNEVVQKVINANPKLIGIFVTGTNLSASTQKMQGADLTCKELKALCEIPVFYWGLHPSALPERTLKESYADYIVKGENFDTIVNLTRYYKKEIIDFSEKMMGGLYFRIEKNRVESFNTNSLIETENLPMPAWDLLPMNLYMPHNWHIMGDDVSKAKGRYAVISTSIGCPYNCSFCAISALYDTKKVRFWNVDRVIDELELLVKKYNVKYIKILDENFVFNKKYVNDFCSKLLKRKLDLVMWGYARVDTVDQDLLIKLSEVGIRWLAYGIESADEAVLQNVLKGQYSKKILEVMQWTREAGINILANFMFGLPNDTKESMEATLELCKKINPEWINFYVTMPYPGSKDYFDRVKTGLIVEDKWIQYAQYSYECKPAGGKYLSPEEVLAYRDYAFNAFFKDNSAYFELINRKFGPETVMRIKSMTKNKLKRKILKDIK